MIKNSKSRRIFQLFNILFLVGVTVLCLLPILNTLAISFSSKAATSANGVKFLPVDFNIYSYIYVLKDKSFYTAMSVSVIRVVLGLFVNLSTTLLSAYALSKPKEEFAYRTVYVWIFVITMLFGGGLIPTFIVVQKTGLLDSILSLVIPGGVNVFFVILLLNFFRGLPKSLDEAARIDGAGHYRTLWSIYLPLSAPCLATITLFAGVNHWNEWFSGLIYMNNPMKYPLASYLQTVIISTSQMVNVNSSNFEMLNSISDRTTKSAQIFISIIPVLAIYPFLQKYFTTGIVMGSVKE